MPIKGVEVMSLGDAADDQQGGILLELPLLDGSLVQVGDVVAILAAGGKKLEIPSPTTGRLVQTHFEVGKKISVGDVLVSIDTNAVAESHDTLKGSSPAVQELLQHVTDNGGKIADDYVRNIAKACTNVETDVPKLRELASLISDRFPASRDKALVLLEKVLTLLSEKDDRIAIYNSEHVQETAVAHTDLGILLYRLGDMDAALTQLECALELRKVALGETHPEVGATWLHIGTLRSQNKDMDGCMEAFENALKIQKEHLGEVHPLVAASLNNLGAM